MLITCIISLLLSSIGSQPGACGELSGVKQLMAGPPQSRYEYRGRYINWEYEYSVRIPKGFTAYDGRDEARHSGFALPLDKTLQSAIFVSADPNSTEYNTLGEAAKRDVEFLQQQGKKIEAQTITKSDLGTLNAVLLVVTYTCHGSSNRHIKSSMLALSPDKRFLYTLELYSPVEQYHGNRAMLDEIIKSWKTIHELHRKQHSHQANVNHRNHARPAD
jgi:hypothetical protein